MTEAEERILNLERFTLDLMDHVVALTERVQDECLAAAFGEASLVHGEHEQDGDGIVGLPSQEVVDQG